MKKKLAFLAGVLVFLLGLHGLTWGLNYALTPCHYASQMMWEDYAGTDLIDTLFVGSSVCRSDFNPKVFDETLGCHSFNMGTPSQPLSTTYRALKYAIKQHDIDRVVMGFGYFELTESNEAKAEVAFLQAQMAIAGPFERVGIWWEYALSNENRDSIKSVNCLFPWVYNHIDDVSITGIKQNIKKKQNWDNKTKFTDGTSNNQYVGKGYAPYITKINYDALPEHNSANFYTQEIDPQKVQVFTEICKLCEENDIEFIVIHTPNPDFDIQAMGERYIEYKHLVEEILRENGASYYDFNLAKEELFPDDQANYCDFEHLDQEGAEIFSQSVAKLLLEMEKQDVDRFFYTEEKLREKGK